MNSAADAFVLVLDDEPNIRESLVEFLEDCGWNTLAAESGEEALDLPRLGEVGVALVDIRLGGMDGLNFIKNVHLRFPRIRFLIHTGSTDFQLDAELRCIGLIDEDVLYKPVLDMRVIDEAIRKKMAENRE